MKNIVILFSLIITCTHNTSLFANADKNSTDSSFIDDENRLSQLAAQVFEVRFNDAKLLELNSELLSDFEAVLKKEGSFNFPFDSILPISKIQSPDGNLRIFTWHGVHADGTYEHFGFIQYYNKTNKEVLLYPLSDKSNEIDDLQNAALSHSEWFGAIYYDIVEEKSSYGQLYVLLGWDGNSIYSNKKVIESLVFTESGRPKFGKPVFVVGKVKVKRIVFEYSRMASMMLKYDEESAMIVMDHLSPSLPIYHGNPQFYGPDLSYDALKNEEGFWVYYPAINYKPQAEKKRKKN